MGNAQKHPPKPNGNGAVEQYDAIVIGAGVSGLYQLYKLREMGLSVRTFEDAGGVGRHLVLETAIRAVALTPRVKPMGIHGRRNCSKSGTGRSTFSGQPENERYLNYVADKFDLRKDIQLNSRVSSAVYDEKEHCWEVQIEEGQRARAQFLVGRGRCPVGKVYPPV